jgi:hypothetical protein
MYYSLYPGQVDNCKSCHSSTGFRANRLGLTGELQTVVRPQLVQAESLLSNRSYPNARCINGYTLQEKNEQLNKLKLELPQLDCNKALTSADTRLTNPPLFYKGAEIDRFEWPIINPSEFIFWAREGSNTRLELKDKFVPKLNVPDTNVDYPSEDLRRRQNCTLDCPLTPQ